MDWETRYQKGELHWDKGAPSPPLKHYLEEHDVQGRTLVPGCGHGHEVALAVAHGLDALGLDIAPTAVKQARALYPHIAERFTAGDLFDPAAELRGAFDVILEHTCLSGLHPIAPSRVPAWHRFDTAARRPADWSVVHHSKP